VKSNLFLVAASFFVMLLIGELVVFRFLLLPSDIPRIEQNALNKVLRYLPNQEGVWRVRNHTQAPYQINNVGWNSEFDYKLERTSKDRIAIIGDSYIEALQVPFSASAAELLAKQTGIEVYRFGLSGAPLSQYLYILQHEVLQYSPEVIVFNLVYNDFLESFEGSQSGTYTKSFAKWRLGSDGTVTEVPPAVYRNSLRSLIKRSATFRYLVARMHVRPSTLWRRMLRVTEFGKENTTLDPRYEGNIEIDQIDENKVRLSATTFIDRLRQLLPHNIRVLILIDGKRDLSIQDCQGESSKGQMEFVIEHLERETSVANIEFRPLGQVFKSAWCLDKKDLSIPNDGHWSQYTHMLIADQIGTYLSSVGLTR